MWADHNNVSWHLLYQCCWTVQIIKIRQTTIINIRNSNTSFWHEHNEIFCFPKNQVIHEQHSLQYKGSLLFVKTSPQKAEVCQGTIPGPSFVSFALLMVFTLVYPILLCFTLFYSVLLSFTVVYSFLLSFTLLLFLLYFIVFTVFTVFTELFFFLF